MTSDLCAGVNHGTHLGCRAVSFLQHGLHLLSGDVTPALSCHLETLNQDGTEALDILGGVSGTNTVKELVNILIDNRKTGLIRSIIWESTPEIFKTKKTTRPLVGYYHVTLVQVKVL